MSMPRLHWKEAKGVLLFFAGQTMLGPNVGTIREQQGCMNTSKAYAKGSGEG